MTLPRHAMSPPRHRHDTPDMPAMTHARPTLWHPISYDMLLHLAYFLNTVTTVVTAMGGASNAVYQRFCASVRKKDERASINFNVDIQRWILENALPALQSDLRQNKIYAVLMGAQDQPDEPAVALTGKTQVHLLNNEPNN